MKQVIFSSKEDAEKVLTALNEIIVKHKWATVGDYLDLIGAPSSYQDTKFYWLSTSGAEIRENGIGSKRWVLDLPEPTSNDRPPFVRKSIELKDVTTTFDWADDTPIREAIGNAIGLASLCWTEAPTGIFDDARAGQIVNELTAFIGTRMLELFK